jgi:hypothetical protein
MGLRKGEKTRAQLLEENLKYKALYENKDVLFDKTKRELSGLLGASKYDNYSNRTRDLSWMEIACEIGKLLESAHGVQSIIDNQKHHINHLRGELEKLKHPSGPQDLTPEHMRHIDDY